MDEGTEDKYLHARDLRRTKTEEYYIINTSSLGFYEFLIISFFDIWNEELYRKGSKKESLTAN